MIEGLDDLCLPLRLLVDNKVTEENEEMVTYVEKQMKGMAQDVPLERIQLAKTLLDGRKSALYDIRESIIPDSW